MRWTGCGARSPLTGTFASFDEQGLFVSHPNAKRFELGFGSTPLMVGIHATLSWFTEEVGLDWAYGRVRQVAEYARERLSSVEGLTVTTPPGTASGLTQSGSPNWEPMAVVEELGERDVVIRSSTTRCASPPGSTTQRRM